MKTPLESPKDCFLLREVQVSAKALACYTAERPQSLYSLPSHNCIVAVLDSFYDPKTRLFHMVMEHMDQNLYQLIKSRHGKKFDVVTIKNIL